jgi:hypothetical protein
MARTLTNNVATPHPDLSCFLQALEQENGDVHSKSVALVRNLLTCHDIDPRYSEEPEHREESVPFVYFSVADPGCSRTGYIFI